MSFGVQENCELLKISAMAITTIIWVSNSAFTFLSVIIKIVEILKKKLRSNQVEPEKINEKDLVISNLET